MKLMYHAKVFIFECEKHERQVAKDAGFWFHGSNRDCRRKHSRWGCALCDARISWVWFQPDTPGGRVNAAKLIHLADDSAREELDEHVEAVEQSFAADADIEIPAPEGLEYLPYQRAGIAYALGRRGCLFGDEMGLGKTIQALGTINAQPATKSVLIVCPASLRLNWAREAERWLVRPYRIHVHERTKDAIPADAQIVIVSFALCRKGAAVDSIRDRSWDLLIVDEAHALKNPKAAQTKAVLGSSSKRDPVEGLAQRAGRLLLLTGTPITNRPIELQPLLAALDPEAFGHFFRFAKRYCDAHQKRAGRRMVWDFSGASHLDELSQRLRASVMVRRLKADVMTELPPKRRQIVQLPQNGAARAVAAELRAWQEHESAVEIAQLAVGAAQTEDEYRIAVDRLRAAQRVAFEEMSAQRHALALRKAPVVVEHAIAALESTDKLVIFGHHKDVIAAIVEGLEAAGHEARTVTGDMSGEARQASVDAFQAKPSCRAIVGTIGAMGVGLTLTASSTVLFAELSWVPADVSQAEDRCHRIGQHSNVLIQHLVYDGSLDARMAQVLIEKQAVIDQALDTRPTEVDTSNVPPAPVRPARTLADQAHVDVARQALAYIAARCDGVVAEDGRGFSSWTRNPGMTLLSYREHTPRQLALAIRIATHHRRQLPSELAAEVDRVRQELAA